MKPTYKFINALCVLLIMTCAYPQVLAQRSQFGIGIGGSNYWGDLEPESTSRNVFLISPGFQLAYKRAIYNNFSLRLNAFFGKIKGDDANSSGFDRKQRNLNFHSPIREISLSLEYALWELEDSKRFYTPFVALGAGIFKFNPKTEYTFPDGRTSVIELQPLGTEGQGLSGFPARYSTSAISIPVIGGLKFKYGDNIYLTLEIIARYTTTDYLDDVSTSYLPAETFPATPDGQLASYLNNRIDEFLGLPENDPSIDEIIGVRGSPSANDFFHSGMVTLYFVLGRNKGRGRSKLKCFSF